MTTYDFDTITERRGTDSAKWKWGSNHEPLVDDVLPLWVADMDFQSPPAVIQALQERAAHGVFGYVGPPRELQEVIVERLQKLYNWTVKPGEIIFMAGLVTGINVTCAAVGEPGDGVLMQPPVYGPFLGAPKNRERCAQFAELALVQNGQDVRYEIDFDVFESAITDQTSLFLLCNPHNPVGRVFTRAELERLAEICLKHDIVICSDEIHCDLLMDGNQHIPMASLSPEIADKTITLLAPSKTFNLAGLGCGFAVVQNPDLLKRMQAKSHGIGHVEIFGYAGALAAYREGADWLEELLVYLQANRDYLVDYVKANLPGVRTTTPEGTYLAWLDCREAGIEGVPADFFLEKARVSLNDGAWFGRGGAGFVRLNFGCPRETLDQALVHMHKSLKRI